MEGKGSKKCCSYTTIFYIYIIVFIRHHEFIPERDRDREKEETSKLWSCFFMTQQVLEFPDPHLLFVSD